MKNLHLSSKASDLRKDLFSYFSKSRSALKESFLALFVTILTSAFAGVFLSTYRGALFLIPGLIILVPGAVNMRGTIFGAMGSRLGSAFHLGLIKKFDFKNNVVKNNIYSSLLLSTYLPIILAFFAKLLSNALGLKSIGIFSFILIAYIGSILSGVILLTLTFLISFKAHKRGWDPDNITAPLIASFGDLITIPCLLAAAVVVLSIQNYVQIMASLTILIALVLFILTLRSRSGYRAIILQSLMVLSLAAVFGSSSGVLLQGNLTKLALVPSILILLPAFLGEGGNIGSIFSSRLTTKLHLGTMKPSFRIREGAGTEVLNSYVFGVIVFPLVGFVAYILSIVTEIPTLPPSIMIFISLATGLLLITIVTFVAFLLSVLFYKHNIDPDNVLIPIVASAADILGIICLLLVLSLIGIL